MNYIHNNLSNLIILSCIIILHSSILSQNDFINSSPLMDGDIYKIGIPESGIYKLDYNFLKDQLDIDVDNISSSSIQVFGNRGGALPELIANSHEDGLQEHRIFIQDGNDSKMNPGDYILFYGEGPSIWEYDDRDLIHHQHKNVYDIQNYYFIKISTGLNKQILTIDYLEESVTHVTASGTLSQRYEEDKTNLLSPYFAAQGSGQRWFGDRFKDGGTKRYEEFFDLSDVAINAKINLFASFVARSGSSTEIIFKINNEAFNKTIARTDIANVEANYVNEAIIKGETILKDSDFNIELNFPQIGVSSDGWLDYIEIHADQKFSYSGNPLRIINYNSTDHVYTKYTIEGGTDLIKVWDITIPWDVSHLAHIEKNNKTEFISPSDILRTFMVFDESAISEEPNVVGKIPNQNLHGLEKADLLVIYPPELANAVSSYAVHRSKFSGINVVSVNVLDIYNEFSSGRVDPTAIRNFARMMHKRDAGFRYLLLFGDASFDNRDIYGNTLPIHFIPTYQTIQSFNPITSFPSDDYFALLSDNEGDPNLRGALDISVGRFPVKSSEEANTVINKIIHYETSADVYGNWKLKAGFIADDEDGSAHLDQSDGIANTFSNSNTEYNLEKIYLDAFKQESTPGGERYPAVKDAINKLFFQGAFVINYMGHGGPKGWADEKVLELTDIESWNNFDKLPLLVTATCTFSGFDDPSTVSPGELSFLNSKGGVIGLFSTVRAVYSNSNRRLADAVFKNLTNPIAGTKPTLGEVIRNAKNSNAADTISPANARKFLLIGDPSLRLGYPKHKVYTSEVKDFDTGSPIDTLKALQKVTFSGEIQDQNGALLENFNGIVYPTLFDKKNKIRTLQQNLTSQLREFDIQKNVLYNGAVSVTNGAFSFSFVIPKDINYTFGAGKMSYYATNFISDASGLYTDIIIGGSSDAALKDDTGPEILLYINDKTFHNGESTDENPLLLIDLQDDSGLNVSGNSIGHDLIAIMNNDTKNSLILNDFYESEQDNFSRGSVSYPLSNLSPGIHQITVKAWDIANNSSESQIEFNVLERPKEISKTFVYPNPMSVKTQFTFEQGIPNVELTVRIDIFNTNGSKVASLEENTFSNGYLAGPIEWDGSNGSGNILPAGLYFYKIHAETKRGTKYVLESDMQKIILIK